MAKKKKKKKTAKKSSASYSIKRKGDSNDWIIEVSGSNKLRITLPSSITLQGKDNLSVEDLLVLISNYLAAQKGDVISPNCCSRRAMMA